MRFYMLYSQGASTISQVVEAKTFDSANMAVKEIYAFSHSKMRFMLGISENGDWFRNPACRQVDLKFVQRHLKTAQILFSN